MSRFESAFRYLTDHPFHYRHEGWHIMNLEEKVDEGVPTLHFAIGIENRSGTAGLYRGAVPISSLKRYEITNRKDSMDDSNPFMPASAFLYFSEAVPITFDVKSRGDATVTSALRLHFKTNSEAEYVRSLFSLPD